MPTLILDESTRNSLNNLGPREIVQKYLPTSIVILKDNSISFDYKNHHYRIGARHLQDSVQSYSGICISLDHEVESLPDHKRSQDLEYFIQASNSNFIDTTPIFFTDTWKEGVFSMIAYIYADHDLDEFQVMLNRSSKSQSY